MQSDEAVNFCDADVVCELVGSHFATWGKKFIQSGKWTHLAAILIQFSGDMSISPTECSHEPASKRRKANSPPPTPSLDLDNCGDIHRTGAKCTVSGPQDPRSPGEQYHVVGAFRTKPGRGERTLSMCCTDKLTKWTILGIQGALLMLFLAHPIYIHQIVLARCPFNVASFDRSIVERTMGFTSNLDSYLPHIPSIVQAKTNSLTGSSADSAKPNDKSLLWHEGMGRAECLVEGFLEGVTKKKRDQPSAWSKAARYHILANARELSPQLDSCSYWEAKSQSVSYSKNWQQLRTFFKYWIDDFRKVDVQNFCLKNNK